MKLTFNGTQRFKFPLRRLLISQYIPSRSNAPPEKFPPSNRADILARYLQSARGAHRLTMVAGDSPREKVLGNCEKEGPAKGLVSCPGGKEIKKKPPPGKCNASANRADRARELFTRE